jgi:predicted DNA-binding transcriptional regulator YafY
MRYPDVQAMKRRAAQPARGPVRQLATRPPLRRIDPYHLFNHRGDWYLAAWDEPRRAVRIFALHRMRRVTLTTEPYETPPHGFRLRAYMAHAFGIQMEGKPVADQLRAALKQYRGRLE